MNLAFYTEKALPIDKNYILAKILLLIPIILVISDTYENIGLFI